DGEYVFLGRIDRQVKVRGQLVEPGEVEARLLAHPVVVDAAVVKRPLPGRASEGLVAFVVSRAAPAQLPQHPAPALPPSRLPQRFGFVAGLPRTATGKVDLPALVEAPLADGERAAAPPEADTPEGRTLSGLWSRLLGAADWEQGFFEQGGDSLLLLELVASAH